MGLIVVGVGATMGVLFRPGFQRKGQPMANPPADLPASFILVDHPVVQHQLTRLRDRETAADDFRRLVEVTASLLFYESARGLPLVSVAIETPLASCTSPVIDADFTVVPVLRGGLAMLNGILRLCPDAQVGHLGLYRESDSAEPVMYYNKLPPNLAATRVVLLEPMLSSGRSCVAAVEAVKHAGARGCTVISLIATPAGVNCLLRRHPDVRVVAAAVDPHAGDDGFIRPGLGDAAFRAFGTG